MPLQVLAGSLDARRSHATANQALAPPADHDLLRAFAVLTVSNRRCVSRRVDVWLLPGFPICSTPYALVAKLQYCRLRSVAIAVLVLGGRTNDRSREIASAVCAARDVMQEPTSGYSRGHTSSRTVTVHGSDDSAGSGTFECAQADRCWC